MKTLTDRRRTNAQQRDDYLALAQIERATVAACVAAGVPYTPRRSVDFLLRQASYFHALVILGQP